MYFSNDYLYFFFKDILTKIKTHFVDEQKHIRFGDWTVYDVSLLSLKLFYSLNTFSQFLIPSDRGFEQALVHYV